MKSTCTLKQAIKTSSFNEFIKFLSIRADNVQAKDGLKLVFKTMSEHPVFGRLRVYKLRHRNNSIGFGTQDALTLFSIKKISQNFYIKLNTSDINNRKEIQELAELHDYHGMEMHNGILVNQLDPARKKSIQALNAFFTFTLKVPFVREFVGVDVATNSTSGHNNSQNGSNNSQKSGKKSLDQLSDELNNKRDQEDSTLTFSERRDPQKQKKLRAIALEKFQGKCVITGCNVIQVLDAAHIIEFSKLKDTDEESFSEDNVLILRKDLHSMLDRKVPLLRLKPKNKTKRTVEVLFSEDALRFPEYRELHGNIIAVPGDTFATLIERDRKKH